LLFNRKPPNKEHIMFNNKEILGTNALS
jgi:hypothetical protein